jgi:hypothetical protein
MSHWLKQIGVIITLSLTVAACSRVGLAYRNLDVIIPWTLSDYLEMNHEQKDWFNERLKEHLNWHCTTQLPGYLDWLNRLQAMVEANQITDVALQTALRKPNRPSPKPPGKSPRRPSNCCRA